MVSQLRSNHSLDFDDFRYFYSLFEVASECYKAEKNVVSLGGFMLWSTHLSSAVTIVLTS